jgi:heat shock protein HslJ
MRLLALIAGIALTACAPGDGGAPPASLWNTKWTAQSIAGKAVSPPGSVTLNFADGGVSGNGGCNNYFGSAVISGDTIRFGHMGSTMMACTEGGRMEQEDAFHTLLKLAVRFTRPSSNRLEILASDGRKVEFAATP